MRAPASDALLADEIGARRVLDRRSRAGQTTDHAVVRRAQLSSAQLHARRDAARRSRVLLSLELCRAGRWRHRGSVAACLSRCVAVRSEQPLLRSEIGARRAALAERRCETRSQDEPGSARAVARNARTRRHGHTPPRQSIVDYAGHAGAVAHRRKTRGPESVGNKKRSASNQAGTGVPSATCAIIATIPANPRYSRAASRFVAICGRGGFLIIARLGDGIVTEARCFRSARRDADRAILEF